MLKATNPSSSWFDVISSLVMAHDFAVVGIASSILPLQTPSLCPLARIYPVARHVHLGDRVGRIRSDTEENADAEGRPDGRGMSPCATAWAANARFDRVNCYWQRAVGGSRRVGRPSAFSRVLLRRCHAPGERRPPFTKPFVPRVVFLLVFDQSRLICVHERELCTLIFVLHLYDLKSDFSLMHVGLTKYQLTCGSVGFNSWAPTYQILCSMESGLTETRRPKVGDRSSESTAPTNANSLKSSYCLRRMIEGYGGRGGRIAWSGGITKNAGVLFDEMPVKHLVMLAVYGVVCFHSSSSLVLRMGDVVFVKPIPRLACSGKCIAWCYEEATEDLGCDGKWNYSLRFVGLRSDQHDSSLSTCCIYLLLP